MGYLKRDFKKGRSGVAVGWAAIHEAAHQQRFKQAAQLYLNHQAGIALHNRARPSARKKLDLL